MDNTNNQVLNRQHGESGCSHSFRVQEYAYGGPTGKYICLECERLLPAAETVHTPSLQATINNPAEGSLRLPAFSA